MSLTEKFTPDMIYLIPSQDVIRKEILFCQEKYLQAFNQWKTNLNLIERGTPLKSADGKRNLIFEDVNQFWNVIIYWQSRRQNSIDFSRKICEDVRENKEWLDKNVIY